MSSSLTDAIIGSIASSLDPNVAATRDFVRLTVEEKRKSMVGSNAELVEIIEKKLSAANDRKAPPSVIAAFEKLLAQATAV